MTAASLAGVEGAGLVILVQMTPEELVQMTPNEDVAGPDEDTTELEAQANGSAPWRPRASSPSAGASLGVGLALTRVRASTRL
ncbi:hypothetical protein AB0G06_05710 [Nonomuraea dietziae]|uniref:hypothetical protein n=1 Tax=Nonomuraea dietziae TaxID=65515 RepID=UPI0033DC696A